MASTCQRYPFPSIPSNLNLRIGSPPMSDISLRQWFLNWGLRGTLRGPQRFLGEREKLPSLVQVIVYLTCVTAGICFP